MKRETDVKQELLTATRKIIDPLTSLIDSAKKENTIQAILEAKPYLDELGLMNAKSLIPVKSIKWVGEILKKLKETAAKEPVLRKAYSLHKLAEIINKHYPEQFSNADREDFQRSIFKSAVAIVDNNFFKENKEEKTTSSQDYKTKAKNAATKSILNEIREETGMEEISKAGSWAATVLSVAAPLAAFGAVKGAQQMDLETIKTARSIYNLKKAAVNPYQFDEKGFKYYQNRLVQEYLDANQREKNANLAFAQDEVQIKTKALATARIKGSFREITQIESSLNEAKKNLQEAESVVEKEEQRRERILEAVVKPEQSNISNDLFLDNLVDEGEDILAAAKKGFVEFKQNKPSFADIASKTKQKVSYVVSGKRDINHAKQIKLSVDEALQKLRKLDQIFANGFYNYYAIDTGVELLKALEELRNKAETILLTMSNDIDEADYKNARITLGKTLMELDGEISRLKASLVVAENKLIKINDSLISYRDGKSNNSLKTWIEKWTTGQNQAVELQAIENMQRFIKDKNRAELNFTGNELKVLEEGSLKKLTTGFLPGFSENKKSELSLSEMSKYDQTITQLRSGLSEFSVKINENIEEEVEEKQIVTGVIRSSSQFSRHGFFNQHSNSFAEQNSANIIEALGGLEQLGIAGHDQEELEQLMDEMAELEGQLTRSNRRG